MSGTGADLLKDCSKHVDWRWWCGHPVPLALQIQLQFFAFTPHSNAGLDLSDSCPMQVVFNLVNFADFVVALLYYSHIVAELSG